MCARLSGKAMRNLHVTATGRRCWAQLAATSGHAENGLVVVRGTVRRAQWAVGAATRGIEIGI